MPLLSRVGRKERVRVMAKAKRKASPPATAAEIGKRVGVAASTIRARKARGTKIDKPPQLRLTAAQSARIARAKGTAIDVAKKFGCSPTTVKRLRRQHAAG